MKEAADLDMTFEDFVKAYTRDMKPKLKHNTWLTKEHILRTKLLPYFKDKKMRDIRPTDIIQWQNEQLDINFDNKVIRITKSYQRLEGKDVITDPKAPKSKRNVSMPDF